MFCRRMASLDRTSASGLSEKMAEHRRADAAAERFGHGAHRLDLCMIAGQRLERSDAEQVTILPDSPEADVRRGQAVRREDVTCTRRRIAAHLRKVEVEQGPDVGAVEFALVKCPVAHLRHALTSATTGKWSDAGRPPSLCQAKTA